MTLKKLLKIHIKKEHILIPFGFEVYFDIPPIWPIPENNESQSELHITFNKIFLQSLYKHNL